MKNLFGFRRDPRVAAAMLLFLFAAIAIYSLFFDILIPNVQDDSYRAAVGPLFVIPVLILAVGQTLIGGFFLHMLSEAVNPKKADFLRALLVASFMTFTFSLTYVVFPFYGPFYYIVFIYGGPWYALPVEIAFTMSAIVVGTFVAHRLLGVPMRYSFLAVLFIYIGITAAAS